MCRAIKVVLFILLAVFFTSADGVVALAVSKAPADSSPLPARIKQLDRDITHELLRAQMPRTMILSQARKSDLRGYRAQIHQMRLQILKLNPAQRRAVRHSIHQVVQKLDLLERADRNAKLRDAEKQRRERRNRTAPQKAPQQFTQTPLIPPFPAANDLCENATPVGLGTYVGNTIDATNDGSETCVGSVSNDIWYRYTAPKDGRVLVDTFGSDFDTVLSIHSSCPGTSFNEMTCDDDCAGVASCVDFESAAGVTYFIRVGGYSAGDTGTVQLNISLSGSVSGVVTDADTLAPLQGVWVEILDLNGQFRDGVYSNGDGAYTTNALAPGSYYAFAYPDNGYLRELYNNVHCSQGFCDLSQGTLINVSGGSNITGINFALDRGGSISGTVTNTQHDPVQSAEIDIFTSGGDWAGYAYTDGSGQYTAQGLPAGSYLAITNAYGDYENQVYDNIPCAPNCDPLQGTPIQVTLANNTGGIDFQLRNLGHIEGTVRDEATGLGIPYAQIDIYSADGGNYSYGYADSAGRYLASKLGSGSYYAVAYSNDYLSELYDNKPCANGCDVTGGTPIPVTVGHSTNGIDFSLTPSGRISGTVRDAESGRVLNGNVIIYDVNGNYVRDAYVDHGDYTAGGLNTGTYYVYAESDGYLGQVYANLPCPNQQCSPVGGTPISVVLSQTVSGIDFQLPLGGKIAGKVTDERTHIALQSAEVDIYDSSGNWLTYTSTDEHGRYEAGGLLSGEYFVTSYAYPDYFEKVYDDTPCIYCDVTQGTPVMVTSPETTANINFTLQRAGSISGTIKVDAPGVVLEYGGIDIYDSTGGFVAYGYTDSRGRYRAGGLNTGTYHATAYGYGYGYVDLVPELYDNIPCPNGCDTTTGTPIAVTLAQSTVGIDFALSVSPPPLPSGNISGTVVDEATGLPLGGANIDIFNAAGESVGYGYTDETGKYLATGIPEGTVFARATESSHGSELFDNLPCVFDRCDFQTGTPINVLRGATTAGINFTLGNGVYISGVITDAATHLPVQGAEVDIYSENGDYNGYGYTDSNGRYQWKIGAPGVYHLLAYAYKYTSQIYSDIPCTDFSCPIESGTPVVVTDGEVTGIDFDLQPQSEISGIVTRASDGAPLAQVRIDVYDPHGAVVASAYSEFDGSYTVSYLPQGAYYLMASNENYVTQLYHGIVCLQGVCDPTTGTAVDLPPGVEKTGIDFAMSPGGGIRGVVYDSINALPVNDATVNVLDVGGNIISKASVDWSGRYTISGLPPESYYVMVTDSGDYEGQLYEGVPCPQQICSLADGALVHVISGSPANGINFPLMKLDCMFCDDFNDDTLDPNWTYTRSASSWSEWEGNLVGAAGNKTATAYANPAFSGCSVCSIDMNLQFPQKVSGQDGRSSGKISIYGWQSGKNEIELTMSVGSNLIVLKEKNSKGHVVLKAKAKKEMSPGKIHDLRLAYDGAQVQVFIDDMLQPLLSMTPKTPPMGTVGVGVRNTTLEVGFIHVNKIP